MTIITGERNVRHVRLLALRSALKLELKGLKISRGRSAYSIIKSEFGLRGNRESVLAQFDDIINQSAALL